MAIAQWQDDYYTGHAAIDQQHLALFAIVNAIHDAALEQLPDRGWLQQQLQEFAAQATHHFEIEEDLMQTCNYPNYEVHCNTHLALTAKVRQLLLKLEHQTVYAPQEITQVLSDWMIHHIRGEDQQMIRFLRSQNPTLVRH
mgnify:CR=1 FL=1